MAATPSLQLASRETAHPFLTEITLRNFLSFGANSEPIKLGALNVLIGRNGSGKSNFLDGIGLLRSAPTSLSRALEFGGGFREWVNRNCPTGPIEIAAIARIPAAQDGIRHTLRISESEDGVRLDKETLVGAHLSGDAIEYYDYSSGLAHIRVDNASKPTRVDPDDHDQSVLAQRRDLDLYPQLTQLGKAYQRIKIYREWEFGPSAWVRRLHAVGQRADELNEDLDNIAQVVNSLGNGSSARAELVERLRDFLPELIDLTIAAKGDAAELRFLEKTFELSLYRISDGTLRYLCLLAILLNPSPAPLVCIEEPELGVHPDIIPGLAELLIDASGRMQLVVTTHSADLIDALTEHVESVLVCEKEETRTTVRRLEREPLEHWLKEEYLGRVWARGVIGGNRW